MEAPIPAELLDQWTSAKGKGGDLALPQRNEFIATDFSLRCEDGADGAAAQSNGAARADNGSANGSAKVCFWVESCMLDVCVRRDRDATCGLQEVLKVVCF